MTKEQIYERMTVPMVCPGPDIPCEFGEGTPCEALYKTPFVKDNFSENIKEPLFTI